MKILANSIPRDYSVQIYPRSARKTLWNWVVSETSAYNARSMAEEIVSGYEPDEILRDCLEAGWSESNADKFVNMLIENMDPDFKWIGEDLACSKFTYRVSLLR